MTAGRFTLGRSSSACWTCETPRRVARATLGYSSGLTARSHRAAPAADPSGGACGPTTDRADGWTHDSPGSVHLSIGFTRKFENDVAAVTISYFAYNFIKIHRTLRVSPAMAAGVTTRLFEVSDLVALLVESESKKTGELIGSGGSQWPSP